MRPHPRRVPFPPIIPRCSRPYPCIGSFMWLMRSQCCAWFMSCSLRNAQRATPTLQVWSVAPNSALAHLLKDKAPSWVLVLCPSLALAGRARWRASIERIAERQYASSQAGYNAPVNYLTDRPMIDIRTTPPATCTAGDVRATAAKVGLCQSPRQEEIHRLQCL